MSAINSAYGAWAEDAAIDPYLLWAIHSLIASARDEGKPFDPDTVRLSVLVEFKADAIANVREDPVLDFQGVVPSHLHSTMQPWLRVRPCLATIGGVIALLADLAKGQKSRLVRFELSSLHRLPPKDAQNQQGRTATVRPDGVKSEASSREDGKTYRGRLPRAQSDDQRVASDTLMPLLCVIDDLCNFANKRTGHGHLTSVWHQGSDAYTTGRLDATGMWEPALHLPPAPWSPGSFSGALVGRRLMADAMSGADADDEWSIYRRSAYPFPPMQFSHGSAVLDLVTGTRRGPRRAAVPCSLKAQVHFVQLPVPTVLDTTGGSLACHALDGIHSALERAAPGQVVIVNLSYGSHSGPHDGTSMWDTGLKELLDRYNGSEAALSKVLHVVLPAGNSHRAKCHAHLHVSQHKAVRRLRWKVLPDDTSDNFVELWFPEGSKPRVRVISPSGAASGWLQPGSDPDGAQGWAVCFPVRSAQSTRGHMALVAVGATVPWAPAVDIQDNRPKLQRQSNRDREKSPPSALNGVWTIEVSSQASDATGRDFQFHAWVMRGDAAPSRRQARLGIAGRQTYLLDGDCETVDGRATLNGIACLEHERLWVVGAMRASDCTVATYSAAGPNRDNQSGSQSAWRTLGPDIVFAADESLNRPGLLLGGILSGSRVRVSGTSIAAAAFSRHLYEHLASGEPACTVGLGKPTKASRASPTGHPCINDAEFVLRGECSRLVPAETEPSCSERATNVSAKPS